jgi:hypothetical protein
MKKSACGRFFYVGIRESEHQVSPGVASCRLHPAPVSTLLAFRQLPEQAFLQRSSAYRATLSLVAAPDPCSVFVITHDHEVSITQFSDLCRRVRAKQVKKVIFF